MTCLMVEMEKTFTLQMLRGVSSSHASNYVTSVHKFY